MCHSFTPRKGQIKVISCSLASLGRVSETQPCNGNIIMPCVALFHFISQPNKRIVSSIWFSFYTHACTHACAHTHTHAHAHAHTRTRMHTHACTHTRMHTHTRAHTHTQIDLVIGLLVGGTILLAILVIVVTVLVKKFKRREYDLLED